MNTINTTRSDHRVWMLTWDQAKKQSADKVIGKVRDYVRVSTDQLWEKVREQCKEHMRGQAVDFCTRYVYQPVKLNSET